MLALPDDARVRAERRARRALGVALCLLPLISCKRAGPQAPAPPPLTALGEVTVRDLTPPDDTPAHVDVRALGRALRARLLATGQFAADGPGGEREGPATRADIQVGLQGAEVAAKGVARARVLVRLETRPAGTPGAITESLDGAGEQLYDVAPPAKAGDKPAPREPPPKEPLYEGLIQRVAGDLIDGFVARRRLREASADTLHAALSGDGGELRIEAIRAVGARHVSSEAPRLLALLDDPDEPTRDAALGALLELGDRRAVTALTRSRSLRDRRELSKIIEAISILGGQEADDYLSFVAGSHEDEDIRAEAAAARARLQRRADAAAKPP
jgi:HEAT repeat protein